MFRAAIARRCLVWALLGFAGLCAHAGVVEGWGWNGDGQIGDGTNIARSTPVRVIGLIGVKHVGVGSYRTFAAMHDGSLYAWGDNAYGELGDGTTVNSNVPILVPGLSGVQQAAGGTWHSLAVKSDHTVWAWGWNGYGQIGDNTTTSRLSPVQVWGLDNAVAVAAGWCHSLALGTNGLVYAWGWNGYGQLGDNTNLDRPIPQAVLGLTQVEAIGAGLEFGLAVREDTTVWAWGRNNEGQLGDGSTTGRWVPIQVPGLSDVKAVAGGSYHSLALKNDGTVWAWGDNQYGQLGDGTTTDRLTPVQVTGLTDVVSIATYHLHCMAVKSDGTVWAWGYNDDGQLGDGSDLSRAYPGQVLGLTSGVQVAAGARHSHVIARLASTMWCPDATATITEIVALRGYVRRATDLVALEGKWVTFAVEGTHVGAATTNANGRAEYLWQITAGAGSRTYEASCNGDPDYTGCSDTATVTCLNWATKMVTFDRTQRITGKTELKCRLLRSDNAPLYNRTIGFSVDGTFVISRPTSTTGYASYPYYTVPDGAGAGARTILSSFTGNAGYGSCTATATLTVLRATPYIWVMPRSIVQGGVARLYAYFRRLADYQKQAGKTVTWRIDGTWIADVLTGNGTDAGIARYQYTTIEPPGAHTIRCEFAGDAWVDAGYGEANLTIY